MTKAKRIICFACEEELENQYYENDDGGLFFPVRFFPTINSVKRYYKDFFGETYFQSTGNKAENDFKKQKVLLSHLCIDEITENQKHIFGRILCWTN